MVNGNFEECRIKANTIVHTRGGGERMCVLKPLSLPMKKLNLDLVETVKKMQISLRGSIKTITEYKLLWGGYS